jgi:hypothetical protein
VTSGGVPASLLGRDIRYLKTDFDGLRWGRAAGPLGPVPWIHGVPLAVLIAALIVHGRRRRLESDAVALRRSSAQRRARARLRSQGEDDRPERVAEILEAYLADRIGDPALGATRVQLLEQVSSRGIAEDLLEETRSFLEECDARAFTPGKMAPGAGSLTQSASALVDRLEEDFRRS